MTNEFEKFLSLLPHESMLYLKYIYFRSNFFVNIIYKKLVYYPTLHLLFSALIKRLFNNFDTSLITESGIDLVNLEGVVKIT